MAQQQALDKDWTAYTDELINKKAGINGQAFVAGHFQGAASGKTFDAINPATGANLAAIACCGQEDLNKAVDAARASFNNGVWSEQSVAARKAVLLKVACLIEENREELAALESLDMGKNVRDSFNIDAPQGCRILSLVCGSS